MHSIGQREVARVFTIPAEDYSGSNDSQVPNSGTREGSADRAAIRIAPSSILDILTGDCDRHNRACTF